MNAIPTRHPTILAFLAGIALFPWSVYGGGYVPVPNGNAPITQATSISLAGTSNVLPTFNNATLTNQNTIAEANNNTVKTPSTADPVSTVTGNNYHDETDFVIKGRAGLNYAFTRTFNSAPSATATDVGLGYGWVHSYGMRLKSNDYGACPNCTPAQAPVNGDLKTSSITYTDERGGDHNYLVNEVSPYVVTPPQGEFNSLAFDTPVAGEHTLTFRNGTQYIFQAVTGTLKTTPGVTARLLQIVDPFGNQLNFTYNANGFLATVTDNLGISGRTGLAFTYDTNNHLAQIADWSGRTWKYSVNISGNLASYTDPLTNVISYGYASPHNLTTVSKPLRGVQTAFAYYQNGRTFNDQDALGDAETLDYDLFSMSTRVTDPRGGIRAYEYDPSGRLTKLTEPDGAILLFQNTTTDGLRYIKADGLGYTTQYSYKSDKTFNTASDTYGNVTREQDALGQTIDKTYGIYDQVATVKDKRGTVLTTTFYTGSGTCIAAGKPNTVTISTLSGVANVKLKSYCWNSDGTPASQTDYLSPTDTTKIRTTTFTYDTAAHLNVQSVSVAGWDGTAVTKSFTYDNLGRKLTETLPRRNTPTDATLINLTTTTTWDALDRPVQVQDAAGDLSLNSFDANGQLYQVTRQYKKSGGFDIRVVVQRTFDQADRVLTETDALGGVTGYGYDAAGNVVSVTDPAGHTLHYQYDAMNRRTAVTDANGRTVHTAYDLAGHPVSVTNGNGETTTTAFDAIGRPLAVTDPHGYVSTFVFDADNNRTCAIDANASASLQPKNTDGCTESTQYDELNRPVLIRDALGGTTQTTYDLPGHPLTQIDAEGRKYVWTYDGLGRPTSETDFAGLSTVYSLDQAGNAYQKTNRLGEVTRTTYDALNRPTLVNYLKDGTSETMGYDPEGNLNAVANATVGYTLSYDALNRLTSKRDSRDRSLSFTWDKASHIQTKTTYQDTTASYTYDGAGTLVAISNPDYLTVNYQYDNAGRPLSRVMSSGARTLFAYDNGGWLQTLNQFDAAGTQVVSQSYTRDHVGNITGINVATGPAPGATTYTLDALYRLTVVNAPGTTSDEAFSYDHIGNRLTATRGGASIGATGSTTKYFIYTPATQTGSITGYTPTYDNRLSAIHIGSITGTLDSSFIFDNEGRLTGQSGSAPRTITWDAKGRLATLNHGTTETYLYDPMNFRIGRLGGVLGSLNYYLEGEHLESIEQNGVLTEKYFRGSTIDELVAGYVTQNSLLVPYLFHHDQVMSVSAETDPNGGTQASMAYWAFGETQATTGTPVNRLQYTGRENDGTGLYYYRARYYDPTIGRFISEDPKKFAAGINFFAYCNNSPIGCNDPSGQAGIGWVGLAGAGIGATIGAVTNYGTQLYQNGWDASKTIDVGKVGWSAVTGGGAGLLLTTELGGTFGGTAAIGAGTNLANYMLTTPINDYSALGVTLAATTGALGGVIGGTSPNPYMFLNPSPSLNDFNLIQQMVTPKVLGIGSFGAVAGGLNDMINNALGTPALSAPVTTPSPTPASSPSSSFNDGLGPQSNIDSAAAGGFLIYPNEVNTNQMQSVYSKGQ